MCSVKHSNLKEGGENYNLSSETLDVKSCNGAEIKNQTYDNPVFTIENHALSDGAREKISPKNEIVVAKVDDSVTKDELKNRREIGLVLKIIVTLCNCLMIAIATGFLFGLGVLFVGIIDEFKASRSHGSSILSVFTAIFFGGGGIVGPFMNRVNGGVLGMIGAAMACIGCVISSYAPSIEVLIFSVGILAGIGMTVTLILPFVTVGEMYSERRRDTVLTIVMICPAVGSIVFPYFTSVLLSYYGWRGVILLYGGILLNLVPVAYLNAIVLRQLKPIPIKRQDSHWKEMFDCSLFCNPLYVILVFCMFLMNTMLPVVSLFFVDMVRGKGIDITTGSFLLSINGFASVAGRIITTLIAPCLKRICDREITWCVYMVILAISVIFYVYASTYMQLLITCIVYGLFWGMAIVSYPAMLLVVSGPKKYPSAMGYCNLIGGVGSLFISPLAGLVKDLSGSYDLVYFATTGLCIFAATVLLMIYLIVRCGKCKPSEAEQVEVETFTYMVT